MIDKYNIIFHENNEKGSGATFPLELGELFDDDERNDAHEQLLEALYDEVDFEDGD